MKPAGSEKKILRWEVLIIAAVLLALLATQLFGTSSVVATHGQLRSEADLAGKKFGAVAGSAEAEKIPERWPDAEIVYAEKAEDLPRMAEDRVIDAFLVQSDEASSLLKEYPQLTVMVTASGTSAILDGGSLVSSRENVECIVIRASEYAYHSAGMTLNDLDHPGIRIAGLTGSELAEFPARIYPDAEIISYNSFTDMFMALENGKVDASSAYYNQLDLVAENYTDLAFIGTPLITVSSGFATAKTEAGEELLDEFNAFMEEITANGEYRRISEKWNSMTQEGDQHLEYDLTGKNGTIRVCTTGEWFPMSFFSGNELTGMFVEIVKSFCAQRGYNPVFECCAYSAEIAGLNSGTYDLMADTVYITEERLTEINITRPILKSNMFMVVKSAPRTQEVSRFGAFIDRIRTGFNNNFIRDGRWKMILSGLGVTLLMAFLSALFGTLLGALICRMRMSRHPLPAAFARLYVRLIQGIPILVLLMLLYYLIFSDFPAVNVCILGFSLDFAAYASEIFRSGIESVPPGQARAARALGFTPVRGFVRVVLPQALRQILPVYSGQLISLVKMTSIAGYISVLELTKVSDIIRSRTFDAFFPLITSALIYFLLSWLLIGLMKLAGRRLGSHPSTARSLRGIDPGHARPSSVFEKTVSAENSGKELLVIEHLAKSFGEVTPVKDVSCIVHAGDVISVIGPSGTGKSTFLNLINRLETPDHGSILYRGEDTCGPKYPLTRLRRRVGMVFQSFNLFSHLTIVENVMLAQTELLHRSRQEAYDYAMSLLNMVGLSGKALQYPSELSGGQQQRAAIARTLAMDPEIILFDEPTSALDPTMVGEVLTVIRNLAQRGTTMLIVTHEMRFARDVSTRVFYMDQGIIYEEGTPLQIFENPAKDLTRQFIRNLKVFRYSIEKDSATCTEIISAVDDFARSQMLPADLTRGLLTVSEELCIDTLLLGGESQSSVDLTCEYNPLGGEIVFAVSYIGAGDSPLSDDSICMRILKNVVQDLAFGFEDGKNRITGRILRRTPKEN